MAVQTVLPTNRAKEPENVQLFVTLQLLNINGETPRLDSSVLTCLRDATIINSLESPLFVITILDVCLHLIFLLIIINEAESCRPLFVNCSTCKGYFIIA